MSGLSFFDCNAMCGRRMVRDRKEPYDVGDLIRDMEYFGIDEALVHHGLGRDYDPVAGNERLREEIKGKDGLYPCFAFLPGATGEQGDVAEAVERALEHGPAAARIWPKTHSFSTAEWCVGDLLEQLERRRMPLLIDESECGLDAIAGICERRPRLPVVVTGIGYRTARRLYAVWRRCDNLYVDLSLWGVHRGIEDVCARFGPERLLFGTRWPFMTPGPAITHITYADVSEDEKRLIAGDNLRGLLKGVAR